MHRKVFKTGNNLVVSLPKEMLESLGLRDGAEVFVELDRQNHQILIRPTNYLRLDDVSEEFVHQVSDFIEQYLPALEALARE